MRHALPAKAEGTTGPLVAVGGAGRTVEGEAAGQAGVDGDRFKLLRGLSLKARASSLSDNPTEKCSFIYMEKEASPISYLFSFCFLKPYVPSLFRVD